MWNLLANHLWQSTLVALAIALLCWLLRRDGAHVRYWLWWTASIKFLIPFSCLTALGSWLGLRMDIGVAPEQWSNTVTVVAVPFAPAETTLSPGALILTLWALGALALLLGWQRRGAGLRRVLKSAQRDRSGLRDGGRTIEIYRTDENIEPGVVGIWRPAMLLPLGIERSLRPEQYAAVLAHELCHIKRRDNLTAAVHMLVEAAFWFHPIVWWIGRKLVDERERACDEMVVRLGHDRASYAEGILDVCEHFLASPLRCAAGISGGDLKCRVIRIMRCSSLAKLEPMKQCLLGFLALLVLLIPLAAGLLMQQQAAAQDPAAPDEAAPAPPPPPTRRSQDPPPVAEPPSASPRPQYLPIVKVAPVYPPRAAARGLEGYVIVQYTVTTEGTTKDVVALESSSTLFERSAIESVQKYRYTPRIIDGTPVEVAGVTSRIEFVLAPPNGEDAEAGEPEN